MNSKMGSSNLAVKHQNKVLALVYIGAAILVIIVGLRGLGTVVGDLAIIPDFLIDEATRKIDSNIVMLALFLEFSVLILLALTTFFIPQELKTAKASENNVVKDLKTLDNYKEELEKLKNYTALELKMLRSYLDEYEELSKKMNKIQSENFESLKRIAKDLK
jgi:uncharacterized membrane-anchored protein YhcB (DUF1043 family)